MKPVQRRLGSWPFVPPSDRALPAEEQTTFVLKPLSQRQRMEVWDNLRWVNPDGTTAGRAFQQARELCISNIEDVQNFPPGNPKPWPKDGTTSAKAEYLEQFDDMDILLIGNEVRDHSTLDDEIKN